MKEPTTYKISNTISVRFDCPFNGYVDIIRTGRGTTTGNFAIEIVLSDVEMRRLIQLYHQLTKEVKS